MSPGAKSAPELSQPGRNARLGKKAAKPTRMPHIEVLRAYGVEKPDKAAKRMPREVDTDFRVRRENTFG